MRINSFCFPSIYLKERGKNSVKKHWIKILEGTSQREILQGR